MNHYLIKCIVAKILLAMIKKGADVNAKAADGVTPLHIASENGHGAVVEALLAKGADLNATIADGVTPLYMASQNGHGAVVEALLAKGADMNAIRTNGWTPLDVASQKGHAAVVQALLARGARRGCTQVQAPQSMPAPDDTRHSSATQLHAARLQRDFGLQLRRDVGQWECKAAGPIQLDACDTETRVGVLRGLKPQLHFYKLCILHNTNAITIVCNTTPPVCLRAPDLGPTTAAQLIVTLFESSGRPKPKMVEAGLAAEDTAGIVEYEGSGLIPLP